MRDNEMIEIRELTKEEMGAVSGGWLKVAVGIIVPFLLTPGKQSMQEWLDEHTW